MTVSGGSDSAVEGESRKGLADMLATAGAFFES
jgi:hypothetical protein